MSFSEDYLNNDYESYLNEDETKEKIEQCRKLIEKGQTLTSIDFLEDTIQLCLEHDLVEDGLFLTEALVELTPYNSEAWQFKGILLNNSFDFEQAYTCFQKALSLNPNDVETYINISIAEDNLGLFEDAIESLKKALELEPNNEETLFM